MKNDHGRIGYASTMLSLATISFLSLAPAQCNGLKFNARIQNSLLRTFHRRLSGFAPPVAHDLDGPATTVETKHGAKGDSGPEKQFKLQGNFDYSALADPQVSKLWADSSGHSADKDIIGPDEFCDFIEGFTDKCKDKIEDFEEMQLSNTDPMHSGVQDMTRETIAKRSKYTHKFMDDEAMRNPNDAEPTPPPAPVEEEAEPIVELETETAELAMDTPDIPEFETPAEIFEVPEGGFEPFPDELEGLEQLTEVMEQVVEHAELINVGLMITLVAIAFLVCFLFFQWMRSGCSHSKFEGP